MFLSVRSTGATLMIWLTGIIYAACGVVMYIEYGLSVPRRRIDNVSKALPRSGGDLNYVRTNASIYLRQCN
jgi:hypothetical protein